MNIDNVSINNFFLRHFSQPGVGGCVKRGGMFIPPFFPIFVIFILCSPNKPWSNDIKLQNKSQIKHIAKNEALFLFCFVLFSFFLFVFVAFVLANAPKLGCETMSKKIKKTNF